jgi:protein subunit release factor A
MLDDGVLRIDVMRGSGPDRESFFSAVRVTHLPSGISAVSQGKESGAEDLAAALAEPE